MTHSTKWALNLAALLAATVLLGACGKEVGRVPFSAEDAAEAVAPLAAGEVAFWTDLDIAWEGPAQLRYLVVLVQEGATVAEAECDPTPPLPMGRQYSPIVWA